MSPYPEFCTTSLLKDSLKAFCLNSKAVFAVLKLWFCAEWYQCWKDTNHKLQCPNFILLEAMLYTLFYLLFRLVFGTLYPAYASYKAVRTKNVKEYVKWMMYWIVFALFTCAETFTDVFLSFWFPFYYEIKIILVLWLLSPATKGSSILYRKFVHPMFSRREQEIDDYIAKAKEQGYHTVLHLGTKGVNYATTVLMQTAIKNINLPALSSHSIRTSAHPSLLDSSVATSSHYSDTTEEGLRQHSRSADEVDCRALYEAPAPSEFSEDESTYAQTICMPLEKDTAETRTSKPENRPTTRSRKTKCKRTNNTHLIS